MAHIAILGAQDRGGGVGAWLLEGGLGFITRGSVFPTVTRTFIPSGARIAGASVVESPIAPAGAAALTLRRAFAPLKARPSVPAPPLSPAILTPALLAPAVITPTVITTAIVATAFAAEVPGLAAT